MSWTIDDVRDHAVSEFMTPNPETVEIDAQIAYALQRMYVGGYRHLAVTSQGRVIGVISIRDILKYLAESFPEELLNLPPRPHQRMVASEGA